MSALKPQAIAAALAASLVILGAEVGLGWWLRVPAMVQVFPGSAGMGMNAALSFILIGSGLLASALRLARGNALSVIVGYVVVALAAVALAETIWDIDLGIDQPELHRWINDGNPRPGRTAPNGAIAFLLAGAALVLMRARPPWARRAVLVLTVLLASIGVVGVVGYLLNFEALYRWYQFNRMALPTAVGLIVVSLGLWANWRDAPWHAELARQRGADWKIVYVASALFISIALAAAMMVFVALQKGNERLLANNLQQTLGYRIDIVQSALEQGEALVHSVAARPTFIRSVSRLGADIHDARAITMLKETVRSFGVLPFSAAAVYDAGGRELARQGRFIEHVELSLALTAGNAFLLFADGYFLSVRAPLIANGRNVGTVAVEVPLPLVNKLAHADVDLGAAREMLICGARADKIACFPTHVSPKSIVLAHSNSQGKRYPISYALAGSTGVSEVLRDYRRENVIAAFGPIGGSGLGMVLKVESDTFYSGLRGQVQWVLPLLLAFVTAGVAVMRAQLRPLTTKIVDSERAARESATLLEEKERRLRAIVENVAEGIVTIDEGGTILSFNGAAVKMFGHNAEEAIGRNIRMLMPESLHAAHDRGLSRYLGEQQVELPGLHKDGTVMAMELALTEVRLDGSRSFVGIVRDITARKAAQERLEHLAQHDVLTDLPNRALFYDRLRQAMGRSRRNKQIVGLFYIDIDHFKDINDRLGHDSGDDLLCQFAQRLRASVRAVDTVARLGGDEFTVIAEGLHTPADGGVVAEKIMQQMRAAFVLGSRQLTISVSIGIAFYYGADIGADALIKSADSALYRAKAAGRARYAFAEEGAATN